MDNNTVPSTRHNVHGEMERDFTMESEQDFRDLVACFTRTLYYHRATGPENRNRVQYMTFKIIIDTLAHSPMDFCRELLQTEQEQDSSFLDLSFAFMRIVADAGGAFRFPFSLQGGVNDEGQTIAILRFHGLRRNTPDYIQHYWNGWTDRDGNIVFLQE